MISRSPLPSTALETRLSVWRKNTGETFSSTAVTFTVACSWWALHLPCSRETLFCTVAPLSGMEPLGVEWVLCAQEHLFAHHVSLQFLLLVKGGNACGERDDSNYHSLSDDFTSQEKKYKPYDVSTVSRSWGSGFLFFCLFVCLFCWLCQKGRVSNVDLVRPQPVSLPEPCNIKDV